MFLLINFLNVTEKVQQILVKTTPKLLLDKERKIKI
jgi:hypothetical protein